MKKTSLLLLITFISTFVFVNVFAQDQTPKYGINFDGYINNSFYYDSRKIEGAREGHLLLFPTNIDPDVNGDDLNDQGSFHFVSIQSRLRGLITAPDAFGAKASGGFEAEFYGNTDASINEFRLRHAYIKLNWEQTELLMGQYWHPLFVTSCFPGTVSFNTGIGFQPFSRNPQIRLTHDIGKIKFILAAVGERDFATRGMNNTPSPDFLRNSKTPQLHFQTHYTVKNPDNNTEFVAGFGGGYKSVMPQLVTAAGYKTNELLESYSAIAFTKLKTKHFTVKLEGVYGENMTDLLFAGGFAAKEVLDTVLQTLSYTSIRNAAGWIDISTNGKTWQFGAFAGYNQNLGTADKAYSGPYGLAPNIAGYYRVSTRAIWNSGKARVAAEIEYTAAKYGDGTYNDYLVPQNPNEVGNLRVLIGTYLFF